MTSFPRSAMDALGRLMVNEMTDRCVITREAPGPGTLDTVTGDVTIATTEIYSGPCFLGDRVEGAFASGGFGANPQEWAYDSRTHFAFLRLPNCENTPAVGDIVSIVGGEQWRVTAQERSTMRVTATYRVVRYDADSSRG